MRAPASSNRLRLRASAARTAHPPCGESLLKLTFQTLGRDVMFGFNLLRALDPDPRGLEADDLHVVGHVLPIRMVIALAFFKRIFMQSLPMNQAHGLIIADVCRPRCVSTRSSRASPFVGTGTVRRRRLDQEGRPDGRSLGLRISKSDPSVVESLSVP